MIRPLVVAFVMFSVVTADVAVLSVPRDPAQVEAFRKTHPCPATGKTTGACPGWVVDHLFPLCAGGEDAPVNMQWQERTQSLIKDRLERALCRCRDAK